MQNYRKPIVTVLTFDEFDVITTSGEVLSTDPSKSDLENWDLTALEGGI